MRTVDRQRSGVQRKHVRPALAHSDATEAWVCTRSNPDRRRAVGARVTTASLDGEVEAHVGIDIAGKALTVGEGLR